MTRARTLERLLTEVTRVTRVTEVTEVTGGSNAMW